MSTKLDTLSAQPKWLTILRIALGVILFYKGFTFIQDSSQIEQMVQARGMSDKSSHALAFIIPWVNLLGGLFILTGLLTRFACIVQLPILIGAVFFVNAAGGIRTNNFELILSVIVLILLVVFTIKGSGVLSCDEYFRSYYKAGTEKGTTQKIFEN